MKKEKIKNILLIVIVALVTSFVTAYGVSSTFDSSNVCYKVDSNTGASVQDTIDDLYGRASDYSELKSYFQNNPTSYFNGSDLHVGYNTTTGSSGIYVYGNNNVIRGELNYYSGADATSLIAYNSSGTAGGGTLNLKGNPVKINGIDIASIPVVKCSSTTVTTDSNGAVDIPYPSGTTLLTVSSNWRFGLFRQSSTARVYNAVGDNLSLAKNTEIGLNYCYITTWQ